MDTQKLIARRATEARIFLGVHGFLMESENEKVKRRIEEYLKKLEKESQRKIPR